MAYFMDVIVARAAVAPQARGLLYICPIFHICVASLCDVKYILLEPTSKTEIHLIHFFQLRRWMYQRLAVWVLLRRGHGTSLSPSPSLFLSVSFCLSPSLPLTLSNSIAQGVKTGLLVVLPSCLQYNTNRSRISGSNFKAILEVAPDKSGATRRIASTFLRVLLSALLSETI